MRDVILKMLVKEVRENPATIAGSSKKRGEKMNVLLYPCSFFPTKKPVCSKFCTADEGQSI